MTILGKESRAALSEFADEDIIEAVRVHHSHLRISFGTGVVETWGLEGEKPRRLMFPRRGWWGPMPISAPEYHAFRQLDGDYDAASDPFFVVSGRDISRAGFLTQRLLIHSLVRQLRSEGWRKPVFPEEALEDDLRSLHDDGRHYVVTPGFAHVPGRTTTPPPGMIACNHLADWGWLRAPGRPSLAEAWACPKRLYWALDSLVQHRQDITKTAIIHRLTTGESMGFAQKAGPRWEPPSFYRAVLRDLLGLHRPVVLDLRPGCGAMAVATISLRGIYIPSSTSVITPEGMAWARRIGGEVVDDDGDVTADVAFLGHLHDVEDFVEAVESVGLRAAQVVGFVKDGEAARARVPGTSVVRFRETPFSKKDGAVVVWTQG